MNTEKNILISKKMHVNTYAKQKLVKRHCILKKSSLGLSYLLIVLLSLILDRGFVSLNFFLCLG